MATSTKRLSWWQVRTVREKRLILVATALALLVLIWLFVIRPLSDAQANAEARLDAAVTELARVRAQAASLKQQAGTTSGTAVPQPIGPFLTQSAADQGFTNAIVAPSAATRASVSIPQARATILFGWIAQLEGRGLVVETLSARANADQTIAVDVTFRAGES
jgi:general secretion pathway protein M